MVLNLRAWASARFLTFFLSWAVFQSYWGLWLAHRGFSVAEIGAALSCSLIARAVTVAVIFPVLNRHATLLQLSRIVPWLATAAAVPYLAVGGFPLLLMISAVFGLIYPIMLPLNETIATVAARRGLLAYGPTRALGTAGFMLGTLVAGWLSAALGPETLSYALIGACLLTAVAGFFHPVHADALAVRGSGTRGFGVLLHNRGFLACLLIAVLIQGSHAAYYAFAAIRIEEVATSAAVPLILVVAPLSEFVLFSLARGRVERVGIRALFAIGAVVAVVRWLLLAVAQDAVVLTASQLLHAGSYATTHLAFTLFVRDRLDVEVQGAAQGWYAALVMGVGMAAFTFIAGLQLGLGFATTMITMAIVALLSLLVLPLVPPHRADATPVGVGHPG